ncbi:chemosensory pili system protein ChpC [Gammaproteobacteria bacterium]
MEIRGLLIPVPGDPVLLPSAVLVEVITYRSPTKIEGKPSWLLGMVEWRGVSVPTVSCEGLFGQLDQGAPAGTRIAILSGITAGLPFLALRTRGIPRFVSVKEGDLLASQDAPVLESQNTKTTLSKVYCPVKFSGKPAKILDLEVLGTLLSST